MNGLVIVLILVAAALWVVPPLIIAAFTTKEDGSFLSRLKRGLKWWPVRAFCEFLTTEPPDLN